MAAILSRPRCVKDYVTLFGETIVTNGTVETAHWYAERYVFEIIYICEHDMSPAFICNVNWNNRPSNAEKVKILFVALWQAYASYKWDMKCAWLRHHRETISILLVTGKFPSQRPVTRSFEVFVDLRLNKQFHKQSRRRWFETPSSALWRHCNGFSGHGDNTGHHTDCAHILYLAEE